MIKKVKVFADVEERIHTTYKPYIKEIEIPDDIDDYDIDDYIYNEIDNWFWDENLEIINTDPLEIIDMELRWTEVDSE